MIGHHETVLLNESIDALLTKKDGIYVDGTFGRGGHSKKLLSELSDSAKLYVYDKDLSAIKVAESMAKEDHRIKVKHGSYSLLKECALEDGFWGNISGVLLDLGISSPQVDQSERGFSFMEDGPLDMRMNQKDGLTAHEWLNKVPEKQLGEIIKTFGEERNGKKIAKAIIAARNESLPDSTKFLADLIEGTVPRKPGSKTHPATRTFQAIRIFINDELKDLRLLLNDIIDGLAIHGRIAMIGFHSLEHDLIKDFAKLYLPGNEEISHNTPPKVPRLRRIGRAIFPSAQEVRRNRRARSAVLRVMEKIA